MRTSSESQAPAIPAIDGPWVLVLGGATPLGRRRGRKVVNRALADDVHVIWFDGLGQAETDASPTAEAKRTSRLTVVDFAETESRTLASRLSRGQGWRHRPLAERIWKVALRRIGRVLKPLSCWLAIRGDVARLTVLPDPVGIVYCDETSLTSAWYSARIWPETPVAADWPVDSR